MAARVLEGFETSSGAVQVVPGADEVFDVTVDGELVFTKSMLGRYPNPNDVIPLLRPFMNR